jgi:hypothetical protein
MTKECQAPSCENEVKLHRPSDVKRRKFCSPQCSANEQARRTTERIDEVKWLVGTDHPESIAQRVGFSNVTTMLEMLMRRDENDLAARLRADYSRYMRPMQDEVYA